MRFFHLYTSQNMISTIYKYKLIIAYFYENKRNKYLFSIILCVFYFTSLRAEYPRSTSMLTKTKNKYYLKNTGELYTGRVTNMSKKTWKKVLETYLVNGLINECGKIIGDLKDEMGWFDVSTLKEPYRIEGKKTMGFELAEQMQWKLPDAIFYPTGGGTGLIGMWKAFSELKELGWLKGKLPKMIAVQSSGCAPIVDAFEKGLNHATAWDDANTVASGIRVPVAIGDFLILDAIRQSNGFAFAVEDEHIIETRDIISKEDGLLLCPEGAATAAGYQIALEKGIIDKDEKVVLFNCASGLKYPMPDTNKNIDKDSNLEFSKFSI